MALMGARKQQRFGQQFDPLSNGPYGTPGIAPPQMGAPVQGMGQLPDVANMPAMTAQPMQADAPAKFKPNLLGVIGDAMQVFGGGQATYMNGVREQQERSEMMRQRAMQAAADRETSYQDYLRRDAHERTNKAPDALTQLMINAGIDPKSPRGVKLFETAVLNKTNPFQEMTVTNEDGSQERKIYRPGMPTMPLTDDDWNSAEPLGGPTSPASGNFRY